MRSAFNRLAAAALAWTLAGSFCGRDDGAVEVVMDVSASASSWVDLEGNSSILSEWRPPPPPRPLRLDDPVLVALPKSSLPALERDGRSVRSR